jgi:23S rRNA pseudouridine1911/1915/1917 synthase
MSKGETLEVLFEDNHLLAVWKPAGLPTMGAAAGKPTLVTLAKQYVKQRYAKPGNVYLGVVSRLDAPVTGVVVLARTSKSARRLTEQFRSREVVKVYWALVEGLWEPVEGALTQWIVHDDRAERMRIVGPAAAGAQEARLSYRRLQTMRGVSLLEVELHTGRKHQIRAQLADRGHPILGDRKYGSHREFRGGIALHARRLAFQHPVRDERIELVAHLPPTWDEFSEVY